MDNTPSVYDSKDYKRSRNAYKWECTFEYFVSLLVTDAFLAKILKSIGFSDQATGIVSSLITLAFLFQLFSVFVIRKVTNTKLFAILFHSTSQLLFMSLYLVPFMPFARELKQPLTVACLLLAYFGNYMVSSMIFRWGNSYVDPRTRGRFSAGKEIMSLLSGMVVSLGVGYVMDYFEAKNDLNGSFIFAAIGIFVFCLCDLITLLMIKNRIKPKAEKQNSVPLIEVLRNTLGNKSFRSVVILMILWDVGRYFTMGFLGTYKIEELGFQMSIVQAISIAASLSRALFSKAFGKYTDKRTFAKGVELGLVIAIASFAIGMFSAPGAARWLIAVYTVLYNVCLAGISGNLVNITYSYVDSDYFAEASAIKNSVAGLLGFFASLAGGKILSAVQANGNLLFGVTVYGQQVLFAISALFMILALLYTHFVVARQKVMIQ